jgi:signal transduction histidine kinase
VLNRVLRHNLRNELAVITAHADDLAGRLDGPDAERVDAVAESASTLADLAARAQEVERLLDDTDTPTTPVDVAALVRSVASDVRESSPGATVTVETPDAPTVETRASVLRAVLEHLTENAVVHHDGDPRVDLSVTAADGVTIRVADDGPGIPDHELAAVTSGTETDLTHGSGLGLWLVKWGVDLLGGDLTFGSRAGGGTVVTVRLGGRDGRGA